MEITPADPTDSVDLACSVSEESADLDEDTVTYSFEWLVDGESVGETGATLSHTLTSAGEVWTCVVTPHDGDEAGPSAEASVVPSLWDNDGDGTPFAEDCDDDDPSVALACCGNGVLEPGEDCEDGNVVDGDGCSVLCEFSCDLPVSASELFGFDFESTSGWTSPCSGGASPSLTGGLSGSAWDWGGNHWGQRRMSLASVGAPPIALEYHVRFDESSTGSASVGLGEYYTCSGAAQMVLRPAVYTSFSVDQSEFSLSNYLDASGSDVVAGPWSPVIGSWLEVRTFLNEDFQLGCVDGSPLVSANFDLSGLLIDEVQLGAWVSSSSGWDMPAFDELTVLAP